jgi:Fic family protein
VAELEEDLTALFAEWRSRIADVRSDAADWKLIDALLAQPVLTVTAASEVAGVSYQAAEASLERLQRRGVVGEAKRRRRREWIASEVIDLMSAAESRFRR